MKRFGVLFLTLKINFKNDRWNFSIESAVLSPHTPGTQSSSILKEVYFYKVLRLETNPLNLGLDLDSVSTTIKNVKPNRWSRLIGSKHHQVKGNIFRSKSRS